MVLGLILLASAAASGETRKCDIRVGELVPNPQVARELAEVIIRSRQTPEQRAAGYELHVEPDGETGWVVFQGLPNGPPDAIGNITVSAGGGGVGMRINRCTGAMSNVYYQR
jgi:hypothetical protein